MSRKSGLRTTNAIFRLCIRSELPFQITIKKGAQQRGENRSLRNTNDLTVIGAPNLDSFRDIHYQCGSRTNLQNVVRDVSVQQVKCMSSINRCCGLLVSNIEEVRELYMHLVYENCVPESVSQLHGHVEKLWVFIWVLVSLRQTLTLSLKLTLRICHSGNRFSNTITIQLNMSIFAN